jgi:enamine deaminase RidA (YjgF/YER057c/UK114 family)
MEPVIRLHADGRGPAVSPFSDVVLVDMGAVWMAQFAGIAAVDPVTGVVAGYETHNGAFHSDAMELQVADIFKQMDRLLKQVEAAAGVPMTVAGLTRALVILREDYPLAFARFNDAYIDQFRQRGCGVQPARTTMLRVTLPEPAALVEIQFDGVIRK